MNNRFAAEEQWPVAWRSGLRYLTVFYIITAVASPVIQGVKYSVASIDARVAAINRQSADALEKRDLATLTATNDRLEMELKKMQFLRLVTFTTAALSLGGICLLILGTWQITRQPISRWEMAVRWAVLLPLLLIPFICIGVQAEEMKLLIPLTGVLIVTGHEIAVLKIAQSVGNPETGNRLRRIVRGMNGLMVALCVIQILAWIPAVPKGLPEGAQWVAAFGISIIASIHAATLWQLSGRLGVSSK